MPSELEAAFALQLRELKAPPWETEVTFCPGRRWRFDFCWPEHGKLAVEIEGGTWLNKGRHTTGSGFAADCAKYRRAVILGYRVLRYTADEVNDWSAAFEVVELLRREDDSGRML